MSKSGIQSNRGDGYQTLVAFDWALHVLSNPNYEWLEVDSVKWPVDDVVIGRRDGSKICCQCKKNQPNFNSWSISDLADELLKASKVLIEDSTTEVYFYSRSSFGKLSALKEFSVNYDGEIAYKANLGKELTEIDNKLRTILDQFASNLSTYDFMSRVVFEVSPNLERMQKSIEERLQFLASNHLSAFEALWTRLDHLGMRVNVNQENNQTIQSRLTKNDLTEIINRIGSILASPKDITEIKETLNNTSNIGRMWRRDIGNEIIFNPIIEKIIIAIRERKRSILITGLPGSGKTCVMLELQERLEEIAKYKSDLIPVFIQAREFADTITVQDRQAQGLSPDWIENIARAADSSQVVVVIDSLDVLSIAREHSILTYFLAQIDRLLCIPNVTIVTACRDFDKYYDRRIAQRTWDIEFVCQPLEWSSQIEPLLIKFKIDTSTLDKITRELISNPRELALFVDLAKKEGSFNIVTSQALAQRYLNTVVQADTSLGDSAMQTIEAIANEMLVTRSLTIPTQRLKVSDNIRRTLLSHNILQETQDGKLTFGHQTLLDVLVISSALRQGITLAKFIEKLPPVPFVRPSIRSFVNQLENSDRREFRKQLRTVLFGSYAFHVRRLVAECLAETIPQNEDWSLIHNLYNNQRDIFQVIYLKASSIEWHHFWFINFLPMLWQTKDIEGITRHVYRVSAWLRDDLNSILTFWLKALNSDLLDKLQLVNHIALHLEKAEIANSPLATPLIKKILTLPSDEHSSLGKAIASCVSSGALTDIELWQYIIGNIKDEDILVFNFNNKLQCKSYEFDEKGNFLLQRISKSEPLLDLAISSIEYWSHIRNPSNDGVFKVYTGFLYKTSHFHKHSEVDYQPLEDLNILFNAVEVAILYHASIESDWWITNRTRICFSNEGALCYFGMLACTENPTQNINIIEKIVCEENFFTSSLYYELSTLIHTSIIHLDVNIQNTIQEVILNLYDQEDISNRDNYYWVLRQRAEYILAIPCHLRREDTQNTLDEYNNLFATLQRLPFIYSRGGVVTAPFNYEIFLEISDKGVINLLKHYDGYLRDRFSDDLIGGEESVARELGVATSRHPSRFLELLSTNWFGLGKCFRNNILEGIANYIDRTCIHPQNNETWEPIEKPSDISLSQQILNELERHQNYWHQHDSASQIIQNCASIIQTTEDANRLIFLCINFLTLEENDFDFDASSDLISKGINMVSGRIIDALMILANQLIKADIKWPELLVPLLRRFAKDNNAAVRSVMLRHLVYLQYHRFELGNELFNLIMQRAMPGTRYLADSYFYYNYHNHFETISPWLKKIYQEGSNKDLHTWGRICALATLKNIIDISSFLDEIKSLNNEDAWLGALSIWTYPKNFQQFNDVCLRGIEAGLSTANPHALICVHKLNSLFRGDDIPSYVPQTLIQRFFILLEHKSNKTRADIYGFDKWLNIFSIKDPLYVLEITEIYLEYIKNLKSHYLDGRELTQLLTHLFAQAEEQEEIDSGAMLQRVVILQDTMLTLGIRGVNEWIEAAERA